MRLLPLILVLAGCSTYDLEPEWRPITTLVERAELPFASSSATTTVGSHVYTTDLNQWLLYHQPGSSEYRAILLHEQEHARRQFSYMGLPGELAKAAWIARYLVDAGFRWSEEQRGYYLSITTLQRAGRWSKARTASTATAMSKGYKSFRERMVGYSEAEAWIESVLSGQWKPEE